MKEEENGSRFKEEERKGRIEEGLELIGEIFLVMD